jgi:hypothetical protein
MELWSTSFSGRFTPEERARVPLDMIVFRSSNRLDTAETSMNLPSISAKFFGRAGSILT